MQYATTDDRTPMHPSLKARALAAAAEHRRIMREADAVVLCQRDCSARHPRLEHAHTYGDMLRMKDAAAYECELIRSRLGMERPDVPRILGRMGANRVHVDRLAAAMSGHVELEQRPPLLAARYWWATGRNSHPWLALLGDADAGKTLAATSCLWKFAAKYPWNSLPGGQSGPRRPAMLMRVQSLARMAAWDEHHDDLRGCDLLVLDDFGAENLRPEAEAALMELLDVRYGRGSLTVLTSQLNVADFRARFDRGTDDVAPGRFWRRVRESALVLEGDVLWSGDDALPTAEWTRAKR